MISLKCKNCGSDSIKKHNGEFVCTKCGFRYAPDEISNLLSGIKTLQNQNTSKKQQTSLAARGSKRPLRSFLSVKRFSSLAVPVIIIVVILIAFAIIALSPKNKPDTTSDTTATSDINTKTDAPSEDAPSEDAPSEDAPDKSDLPIKSIAISDSNTYAIKSDGSVYSTITNKTLFENWTDIVAIDSIAALKSDGTVVFRSDREKVYSSKDMTDIVQIASGDDFVVGLKKDGTVVISGNPTYSYDSYIHDWNNIKQIYVDDQNIYGLTNDGKVLTCTPTYIKGVQEIRQWKNIVDCYATSENLIGITSDGKIRYVGSDLLENDRLDETQNWSDIKSACILYHEIAALKNDGTVLVSGSNSFLNIIESWTDIVQITSASDHIIGLKKDGTVVAAGHNDEGECDIDDWTDIISVYTSENHTVGLKKDGTVVAAGDNRSERCDVEYWTDVKTK